MLGKAKVVAFAATADVASAKKFYKDVLKLRLVEESPFAVVFDANGTMLRVTPVPKTVIAPYTVLGWDVEDIAATVEALKKVGVKCERYPGLDQNELGIRDLEIAQRRADRVVQGSRREHFERYGVLALSDSSTAKSVREAARLAQGFSRTMSRYRAGRRA